MASANRLLQRALDNWPAKIIALGVAIMIVLVNDLARVSERSMTIPLEVRLAEEMVPGAEYPNRVRVRLRGGADLIFTVLEDDLVAFADFTGNRADGDYRASVQVARSGRALEIDALEITVEPSWVTVTLEEKAVKSLAVVPSISGFPSPGYELSDYRVTPTVVTVEGPRTRVEPLRQVLTESIELADRTGPFTERLRLVSPHPLVRFPGGTIVEFRAIIVETVVQRTYESLEISIVDLASGLAVLGAPPPGVIRVQGKQLDLEGISSDRIGLFVDASAITAPGSYQLAVRPLIPTGVLVLGIEPARVDLTVIAATAEAVGESEP